MPINIPKFRRVIGPDPNNGIRGDVVRPKLFNDVYDALEQLDGSMTGAEAEAVQTATAPLVTGAPSNRYYATFRSGVLTWAKRTNSVVVEDEGGIAAAVAALGGISGRKEMIFSGLDPQTVPNAGFAVPADTSIFARGSRAAVLTAPAGATGTALLTMSHSGGFMRGRVEGLELNLNAHATMVNGIQATGNNTAYKDISIVDCIVRNALGKGVWTWQTNGILIEGLQAYNCYDAIYMDTPVGPSRIVRPYIVNTVSGRMRFGIRIFNSGGPNYSGDVEIDGAHISGADYATPYGAEAHGISLANAPRSIVKGARLSLCGNPANKLGGGLVLAGSHESLISDVISNDNHATGIWSELEAVALDTTMGSAGQVRGALYTNIVVSGNGAQGMSGSYGAGTSVVNLLAVENGTEGFVTDSENVSVSDFTILNNWQDPLAPTPAQNGGAKAGLRFYAGGGCRAINGRIKDNQAVKTQEVGLASEARSNMFTSIITLDADHVIEGYRESPSLGANTVTNVRTT